MLKFLVMTNFMKWQTISQMLTGFKVNYKEHNVEYNKHIVDKEKVRNV